MFNFTKWNPSEADMLLCSACIQPEEKERLTRFVFKKDLKSSLIGLLMMRKFVSEALNKKYNEIKFTRDEKGKPVLEDCQFNGQLSFNVSHQGNYTVFAGEQDNVLLGVDVMKFDYSGGKSVSEFFRIMARQFSPQEWINIKAAGDERKQIRMFCRYVHGIMKIL